MSSKRMKLRFTVLVVTAIVFGGCVPPADDKSTSQSIDQLVSSPVSKSEIEASFARPDKSDIVYALNEVKKSPLDYDVIQVIACAYSGCGDFSGDWNSTALADPLVKVNLIDVMVQADQRGMSTVELPSLKEEVVALLSSPNPLVVQRSLLVISYLDDSEDVPAVVEVATQATNPVTFRVAIIALKQMSTEEAVGAISTVLENADDDQREAVADLVN